MCSVIFNASYFNNIKEPHVLMPVFVWQLNLGFSNDHLTLFDALKTKFNLNHAKHLLGMLRECINF